MLAGKRDLGEILLHGVAGKRVHLHLARPAHGHADAAHRLGFDALHRERYEL